MNSKFVMGFHGVSKRIQVPAVAAFTLFISQQLPAQANHHGHMNRGHMNRGGGHNINRLARNNDAAVPRNFRDHGFTNHHQRIETNTLSFRTMGIDNVQQNINLNNGINLDLGSQTENITLGAKLFGDQDSVSITVGGGERTLQAGSQVTAAEYVAAKQVLSGAGQTLVVGGNGSAAGGNIDFGAILDGDEKMRASALVNPAGVTVAGDFGKRSDFQLRGDLTNYGSVNAYSSNENAKSGTIRAHDINNEEGATISSSVDLRLRAENDLNNYGAIVSGGSLNLSAGHAINNAAAHSTVSAQNDVSLDASEIVNRGQISSLQGSINIDSPSSLTVDNRLGLLRADNGAINVRNDSYDQSFDTYVCGGDLLSAAFNLNSGQGLMTVEVGQLTGIVSQKGTAAHLFAATDDLVIGKTCLMGDPTFYNTAGNITITGDVSVNQALTIVASGNIVVNNGSDLIAGSFSQGFPITLIAGANITATAGGANVTTLPPLVNSGGVTINGGSAGGGLINFASTGTVVSSQTLSPLPGSSTNGADVLLVAFGGATAGTGTVTVAGGATVDITTGGTGFGDNGDITVIAPGDQASIVLPAMNTVGGSGFGGSIVVTAADPVANNVVYLANGNLSFGGPTIQPNVTLKPNGVVRFNGAEYRTGDFAFITASADNLVQLDTFRDLINSTRITLNCPNGRVGMFGLVQTGVFVANADSIRTDNGGSQFGIVNADTFQLTSTTGDIGNGLSFPLKIQSAINGTSFVFVNGHDTVFILGNDDVNLREATADGVGIFRVESLGLLSIQTPVVVSDGSVSLLASGSTDGINVIGSQLISTANGSVTLQSLNGKIAMVNANLDATTGNINVLGGTGVDIGVSTLHTDAGNINIETNTGAITIGAANIDTGNGNIGIVNLGTDKKTTTVKLTGTTINTLGQPTNGDITISIGTPGPNVLGKAPKKNVTITPPVGGGQIFFGTRGITTNAPNSTLTVIGADIIFNNPLNKKGIVLSGANITADPPVAAGVFYAALSTPSSLAVGISLDRAPQLPIISSNLNTTFEAINHEPTNHQPILSGILPDGINLVTAQQLMTKHVQMPLEVSTKLLASSESDDSFITTSGGTPSTIASIFCEDEDDLAMHSSEPALKSAGATNSLSLEKQTVFFAPRRDTSVETQFGRVTIAGGSLAMVTATPTGLAVFNLHDNHKNAVSVTTAQGETMHVAPGCHILITPHSSRNFAEVNAAERVAHRAVSKHSLKNGSTAFCSEFSIPSAVESQHAIKEWLCSDNAKTRKQVERAIKTWAALFDLRRTAEPYKHFAKSSVTAMANNQ